MIIVMDFGTFLMFALFVVAIVAGSAMTATEWILANMATVMVIAFVKAVLFSFIAADCAEHIKKNIWLRMLYIALDMVRSYLLLYGCTDAILGVFKGTLLAFIFNGIGAMIFIPLYFVAYLLCGLLTFEELPILGQLLSLAALGLCFLILYVGFGGW